MATFLIDNDPNTAGIQDVTYDQSAGVQTPNTTDTGNEVDVTLSAGQLDGLDSGFETFLANLTPPLSTAQKDFAVLTDAASSSPTFIKVTADSGETLNDLKLLADSSTALTGITTLDGDSLYVHVDASGNYATLWTSSDDSGRIVGAVALTNETIDNVTTHTATAGVQMVFFEAINHTDTDSQDESVPLSDVLQVAVDTAVSFDFSQLDAGNFLWAAVGDGDAAMLITGQDLNVKDSGKPSAIGNIEKGGADPSDSVNTSKATDTTIGINAQHFAPTNTGNGATGVFTFVTGYAPLALDPANPVFTGQNVKQIDYDDYINVSSASVFISQLTGGSTADIHFSFWEAGGGGTDQAPIDLVPEEGYSGSNSYIGDQDTDSHLKDDTEVAIASVTIDGFTWNYNDASNGTPQGNITVTITGNDVEVDGATANDLITFTALNDPQSTVDGTFNRIDIQALQGSAAFDIGHIDLTQGGLTSADLGNHLFVDDDGPSLTPQVDGSPTPNDLQVDNDLSDGPPDDSTDSSSYGLVPGTDGQKSYTLLGPEDSSGDFQWTYDDTDHTAIHGTYKGTDLYTLVLDSTTGGYTFTMIDTLPGSSLDLNPAEVIKAGAPDSPTLQIGAVQNDDYVEMSADSDVGNGNINESHGFVGVDNGNLDAGESLTFTLHEGDGTLITFEGIQIGTKSAQGGVYTWVASNGATGTETVGKNGTIDISATDLLGATIDSITITKESGPATKIGIGDVHLIVPPVDVQLGFAVELKDGDNDAVTQSFVVDIDANNDGIFDGLLV